MPDNKRRSEKKKPDKENKPGVLGNRQFRPIGRQISNLIGQASLDLYGTDRKPQTDSLNKAFEKILSDEVGAYGGRDETGYLAKLNFNDRRAMSSMEDLISGHLNADSGQNTSLQAFMEEAYKNKLLEQSDLHEVSSQLIELYEAILITRDAVISPDNVTGRLNRTLGFKFADGAQETDYIPIIEKMEERFGLQKLIRNFIVPRTLEYGEFYVYTIPYSQIFSDFSKEMNDSNFINRPATMKESSYTLLEYVSDEKNQETLYETVFNESAPAQKTPAANGFLRNGVTPTPKKTFAERVYEEYASEAKKQRKPSGLFTPSDTEKKIFCENVNNMMERVSISNSGLPLPVLEEGAEAIAYLMDTYYKSKITTEAEEKKDRFHQIISGASKDGIQFARGASAGDDKAKNGDSFDEFTDCYIKMLSPIQVVPVKIIDRVIGYYYIQAEDATPLAGDSSTNLIQSYGTNVKQKTIIDTLASAIVASFDKKFLRENERLKDVIVEAITYYNLNEKRVKFQFIPTQYIQVFKIDEDENGEGTSMIKKSLFYAKLYLMLILFKIMSIIMNSNDTKVNYIKSSGIDKDVARKIQELARIRQSRQVNIYDLFNYTTLINKVGMGSEMYVPTGRSGERPIETEILSGQDVQLNTDLLEMLKNAYILGTGVPAALINYMNEADFAKVVEQNNTKFLGRVMNYQASFNQSITEWYKKIMSWSTTVPPDLIRDFEFTLQQPKSQNSSARSDAISNYQSYQDFAVNAIYGDNTDNLPQEELLRFKQMLIEDQLPQFNVAQLREFKNKAHIAAMSEELRPKPENGDSGDDIGLEDEF